MVNEQRPQQIDRELELGQPNLAMRRLAIIKAY